MRIAKERYFKNMARALLRGFFAGLKERGKKGLSRRQRAKSKAKSASISLVAKRS
jgi:hypothetical protein